MFLFVYYKYRKLNNEMILYKGKSIGAEWKTRTFEGRIAIAVWVQVPSDAP